MENSEPLYKLKPESSLLKFLTFINCISIINQTNQEVNNWGEEVLSSII